MPTGWTLVGLQGGGSSTPCGSQFSQVNGVEGPTAGMNACTCGCSVTAQPTCSGWNVGFDLGGGGCGMAGTPPSMANASSCNTDMYKGGNGGILGQPSYKSLELLYSPNQMGGTCAADSHKDQTAITYSATDHVCTPNTEPCTGNQCMPQFGGGMSVCIASSGTQSCPGTTFTVRHVIGDPATFSCSSGCTCTLTGAACDGVAHLYDNGNCMGDGNTLDIPVGGAMCNNYNAKSDTYGSYSFTASPSTISCSDGGATTVQNLTQANLQTVCCAP